MALQTDVTKSQVPSDDPTGAFDPDFEAGLAAAFGPESTPGGWSRPPLLRDDSSGNAPLVHPSSAEMPRAADSRYQLLGEIARGGMGVIIKGRDPDLGRDLAIKVLKADLTGKPAAEQRFVEEAQVGGQLQHPGVVPVYDLGRFADGRPYFAMKLVKGHTLAELLADRPDLAADRGRLLRHFLQVCQTLAYAHSKGVIHRDLKPANIMVGPFDEVLVMDWGLAKVLPRGGIADEEKASRAPRRAEVIDPTEIRTARASGGGSDTQPGSVMGTPAFMPPEQAGGEVDKLDERVDVFGLGAILCVILTGKPPYVADSHEALRLMAVRGQVADAFARLDGCGSDAELVTICKQCLSPDRDLRPRSAREVAGLVSQYTTGVENRAHQAQVDRAAAEARAEEEANTRRAAEGKVVAERKRRRAQLALAASVGLLAVAGGAFGWYADRQVTERRLKAEAAREQVNRLVALSTELRKEYRFAAAAAALAEARDAAGSAPELMPKVEQATSDLGFVADLDAVRGRASTWIVGRGGKDGDFNTAAAPAGYRQVFAGRGLDVAADPEGVGARVAASTVHVELVAALDDWLVLERDEALRGKVLACLRRADPDSAAAPFRDPAVRKDKRRLEKLVDGVDAARLSPGAIVVIARMMEWRKMDAAPLLRQAVALHPRDFEVVFALAQTFKSRPADADEQIGAYRAARALRPDHYATLINLGSCLRDKNEVDAAIALHREAARVDPTSAHARIHVGLDLSRKGDVDGAVAEYREVVRIDPKNPAGYLNLSTMLCDRERDYDGAEEAARQAIRLDPEFADAHYLLGNALEGKARLPGKDRQALVAEAIACYKEAIRLNPDYANAHLNLGAVLCDERRDYDAAIVSFRDSIRLDANNAMSHFNLGIALVGKGDLDGAITAYREAVRLDPTVAAYYFRLGLALEDKRDLDEAVAAYREAIRLDPEYTDAHFNLAAVLADKGDVDGAITAIREAIRLGPQDGQAHFKLGTSLYKKGDLKGAVAAFRDAARLNPKDPSAAYNLGRVLAETGDVDGAITAYQKAIELDPKHPNAHVGLGNVFRTKRDFSKALAAHKQAVLLSPKDPLCHFNLGCTRAQMNDVDGAIASFRETIQLQPEHDGAYMGLGDGLRLKGDLDGAEAAYRKAIELDPDNPWAHFNLGTMLGPKGDLDGAIAHFREATRLDPTNHNAFNWLGTALYKKGDRNGAIAAFREVVRLDPKNGSAHNTLGGVLSRKGDLTGAIAAFRQAVHLEPKLVDAHNSLAWILATGPDGLRDGKQAVESATRACELTNSTNAHTIDTLAAAYAEAGDFDKAVEHGKKAAGLAAGDKKQEAAVRARIELYEKKQRYRDPEFAVPVERGPSPREVKR